MIFFILHSPGGARVREAGCGEMGAKGEKSELPEVKLV